MTERFGVVTEKGTFLFVNDVIPESTEKRTSRAANSIFFPRRKIFEGIYLMINTTASFWRENTLVYLS